MLSGSCLCDLQSEEGHALGVWQGREEEGVDQEPGQSLLSTTERASDQSRRLPRAEEVRSTATS